MKSKYFLLLVAAILLTGCSRDPDAAKKRYLESGNKYFQQGKLKEASIMYRTAIKKDPRFGEGYLKLGEVEMRRGNYSDAVSAWRRAMDLMPTSSVAAARLGDIYLAAYASSPRRDPRFLTEARQVSAELTKRNPNSYEGLRLSGLVHAVEGEFPAAVDNFKAADAIKPDQPDLQFALAQALTADQKFDEAERVAKTTIEKHKEYSSMYEFLFAQYLRRNRPAEAEQILDLKIKNNPKNTYNRLQKAAYFYATRRYDQAQPVLQQMLDNPAEFPNGRSDVADFYFRTREYDKALKLYEEGVRKEPQRKNDYKLRILLVKVSQNKPTEAMTIVEEVLKEEPNNNNALQARSALALQSGDQKQRAQALTDLQTLNSRLPQNPVVRFNLARAYQQRGDLDAARVQYSEAIKNRPDFLPARLGLAHVYAAKQDLGKALQEVDETLKLSPDFLQAKIFKANLLLLAGSYKGARTEAEQVLKVAPNQTETRFILAGIDLAEKRYKEAEANLKALTEQFPNDRRPMIALAEVYAVTNRGPLALEYLQAQIQKHPDASELKLARANLAVREKNYDLAIKEYQAMIDADPKALDIYMKMGEAQRRKGDVAGSFATLQKAQQLAPQSVAANLQLAMTYEQNGRRRDAKGLYENIIKVEPNNAVALNNLAFIIAEDGGDLDLALTFAQKAKQQLPNHDDVADTLGWIYIKKNLSDSAITIFQDLTVKQPNNALYHYHMGMALFQKGDKVKAKQSLQTALAKKPDKDVEPKIRELLGRIG